MPKVSFFTPIVYTHENKTFVESCREKVDGYFHWNCKNGKKAYIIQAKSGKEKAVIYSEKTSGCGTVAKVISCFTIVIPLFMLTSKLILRLTHSFQIIDLRKKLGKGLEPDGARERIEALMPQILQSQDDPALEWISKAGTSIFKLSDMPNTVFRIVGERNNGASKFCFTDSTQRRYENTVRGLSVKLINRLGLLIIPPTKIFEVQHGGMTYKVIAEKTLAFNPSASVQERNYIVLNGLDESVRQLAVFISKFNLDANIVKPCNIPILDDNPNLRENRRIGLIELEKSDQRDDGAAELTGQGLISCVGSRHLDLVIETQLVPYILDTAARNG